MYANCESPPGILVIRIDAPIYYANVEVSQHIMEGSCFPGLVPAAPVPAPILAPSAPLLAQHATVRCFCCWVHLLRSCQLGCCVALIALLIARNCIAVAEQPPCLLAFRNAEHQGLHHGQGGEQQGGE